jgi:hypothetical protein
LGSSISITEGVPGEHKRTIQYHNLNYEATGPGVRGIGGINTMQCLVSDGALIAAICICCSSVTSIDPDIKNIVVEEGSVRSVQYTLMQDDYPDVR